MSDWFIKPETAEHQRLYDLGYRVVHAATGYFEARIPDGKILAIERNIYDCWTKITEHYNKSTTDLDAHSNSILDAFLKECGIEIRCGWGSYYLEIDGHPSEESRENITDTYGLAIKKALQRIIHEQDI